MTLSKIRTPEGMSPSGRGLFPTMPCLERLTTRRDLAVISRCFHFVLQKKLGCWLIWHRLLVHREGHWEGVCVQVHCSEEAQLKRRCGRVVSRAPHHAPFVRVSQHCDDQRGVRGCPFNALRDGLHHGP